MEDLASAKSGEYSSNSNSLSKEPKTNTEQIYDEETISVFSRSASNVHSYEDKNHRSLVEDSSSKASDSKLISDINNSIEAIIKRDSPIKPNTVDDGTVGVFSKNQYIKEMLKQPGHSADEKSNLIPNDEKVATHIIHSFVDNIDDPSQIDKEEHSSKLSEKKFKRLVAGGIIAILLITLFTGKYIYDRRQGIAAVAANAKVGSTVYFGQEFFSEAPQEWIVLSKSDNMICLISKNVICTTSYDNDSNCAPWEECDLRSWLNGTYYRRAFSENERYFIKTVSDDKVALLTSTQYYTFRSAIPSLDISQNWWVKSLSSKNVFFIQQQTIQTASARNSYGVRPVIWIDRELLKKYG